MDHGMGHFDAGGPAVGEDATDLARQGRQQLGGIGFIAFADVQRRGQLAFQTGDGRDDLFDAGAADEDRRRTEDFFSDDRVRLEGRAVGREEGGLATVDAFGIGAAGDGGDAIGADEGGNALFIGVVDARRQHDLRRSARQGGRGSSDEAVEVRAIQRDDQTGVGAELARPHGQRTDESGAERFGLGSQCAGQQHDRVDRRHFGIDRDRFGAFGRDLHQRRATTARTGEADGLDAMVGDQRGAQRAVGARQVGEDAFMQAKALHGSLNGAGDQLAGAGVGAVTLDHDGRTGGEGRCGVTTRHREGEREVGRTEDGDGADRMVDAAQVGARQRGAVRQCLVDGGVQPVAQAHIAGEQAQLADGAATLAFQTGARQAGFGHGGFDQQVADGHDIVGHGFQESRAGIRRQGGEAFERGVGQRAGFFDFGRHGAGEGDVALFAGGRVDGVERLAAGALVRADEDGSVEHGRLLKGVGMTSRSCRRDLTLLRHG
eukprot:Opistho-2@39022